MGFKKFLFPIVTYQPQRPKNEEVTPTLSSRIAIWETTPFS